MVDLDPASILLLISGEVFQLLPRALPWQSCNNYIIDSSLITRRDGSHGIGCLVVELWGLCNDFKDREGSAARRLSSGTSSAEHYL